MRGGGREEDVRRYDRLAGPPSLFLPASFDQTWWREVVLPKLSDVSG